MHEVLHVAILVSTILGAGGVALLVLWPLIFDHPPTPVSRNVVLVLVAGAAALLLVEWRFIH
jgi:hypothetical protein